MVGFCTAARAYLVNPFDYFGSAQYKYAQDRRESYLARAENLKLKTQSHSAKFKSDSVLTEWKNFGSSFAKATADPATGGSATSIFS